MTDAVTGTTAAEKNVPTESIMVGGGNNPFTSAQHSVAFERRVVRIVHRVHSQLRAIAEEGIARAGGSLSTAQDTFLGLVNHVEEVALTLYRAGAASWSDARIVEEAMRRAPRLTDLELQEQIFETDAWFAPTEGQRTQAVANYTGVHPQTRLFPHALTTQLARLPREIRAHALMLAWTQAGRGDLDLAKWREMFKEVGFTQDSRNVEQPSATPTLYRAANAGYERGWSWTSSLDFARYFQSMTNSRHVWTLENVAPEAVLARYNTRGEAEWVIDMDMVDAEPVIVLDEHLSARAEKPALSAGQRVAQFEQRKAAQSARRKLSKKARRLAA